MKITLLAKLVLLVLMMAIPVWFFGSGVFTRDFSSGESDSIEELKEKTPRNVKTVVTDKEVEVYKWLDEYGVTQFSETAPADGVAVELMVLSPDTNVMDALKVPEEEDKAVQKPNVISLGNPYSPEGMKDMINDSLQIQEQITKQQAEQEKMMNEMFNKKQ